MIKLILIGAVSVLALICFVACDPPQDPIKCSSPSHQNINCTITNAYGVFPDRTICHGSQVFYPKTESQLISIVANATLHQRKIKVATSTSHSIPKLVCPDGKNGTIISTKYLNRTIHMNSTSIRITVEPGMTLRELIKVTAEAGLAIPYTPYWWGLTVGGMLGTGAHGSTLRGLKTGSAVHDYVTELRIVTPAGPEQGYATVRILKKGDPHLEAAKVSLGVLGVISQVTLQLEPLFKRSITFVEKKDIDLGDEAVSFGFQHEFADITWFPTLNKAVYRVDDRLNINIDINTTTITKNGLNDFMGFQASPTALFHIYRDLEESVELSYQPEQKCIIGEGISRLLIDSSFGYTNNGYTFNGYPVIGNHNRLQASGSCLDAPMDSLQTSCPWDPRVDGLFFFQSTFTIALSQVKNFIEDVQRLVSLVPHGLCGLQLYNGILMRYVTYSSAYLGKEENGVDFDITYYRSHNPMTPRMYEDILEEIEQMGVFKYGGLPHWGKNRNVAFVGVIDKYKNASEFLKVKELYDPMGLFSSEWTDQILGLNNNNKKNGTILIFKDGCGLEGLCICSKDSHCSPKHHYFCLPGKIYKQARVCTYVPSKN